LIKEFQRLKEKEQKQLGWDIKRNLTKINYRIHTDAIKANLLPDSLSKKQVSIVYANEADVLRARQKINCHFMHLIFTPYLANSQSQITRNSLLLLRICSIELTKSDINLSALK